MLIYSQWGVRGEVNSVVVVLTVVVGISTSYQAMWNPFKNITSSVSNFTMS